MQTLNRVKMLIQSNYHYFLNNTVTTNITWADEHFQFNRVNNLLDLFRKNKFNRTMRKSATFYSYSAPSLPEDYKISEEIIECINNAIEKLRTLNLKDSRGINYYLPNSYDLYTERGSGVIFIYIKKNYNEILRIRYNFREKDFFEFNLNLEEFPFSVDVSKRKEFSEIIDMLDKVVITSDRG